MLQVKNLEKEEMSVSIERNQLVDIARSVYDGSLEIETHLSKQLKKKPIGGFLKKVEEKLWRIIVEEHPWKDFTGQRESLTRANIFQKICTVLKSKFVFFCMRVLAVLR